MKIAIGKKFRANLKKVPVKLAQKRKITVIRRRTHPWSFCVIHIRFIATYMNSENTLSIICVAIIAFEPGGDGVAAPMFRSIHIHNV